MLVHQRVSFSKQMENKHTWFIMMLLYIIHDNPIPIWNTTYACSLFVSGNSLLHGFLMFLGRVMNMTIPSQYETPPMHAPFLFPEILYSMVSWCFLGVSWTWQSHPNMKHHLCMLPFCFRKFSTPWFLDVSWACHEHDNPIPIWNTTYACSLFVSGNSLLHGFLMFLGRVMNMTIPSQYETPPMHAPFLFPEILYSMVSWCFLGVSWTWQSHPNMKHHLCMLPFCFRKFSTPWFLDVSWACHEHDNPIPIWNTTYACSLFVSGNSLLHGFLMFLGRVMNMTIPSQYETPPMHAPFLFPEILYSMVSWCFLGVSWTWQSHPNMKHHLCMLPFCFRKFSTPWFLDVSWACHEHDNPIPIWNTTYACSLFVSGNSLLHGFLMFLGRVMNMTIPSQYETPPMHAPFLFPEILYSMVSWCFLGVSWTWQSHPNMKHHLCMLPFCFRKFSTPWFLDVSWACHEHDNPIPIWNTTYACSLFVSENSLLHGFLMFLGRVMNMTIPSQYETPPMHAPFLFPEILYSMVSWCFLGVSWTWQSHPNMKHHLCMLPFCFRKFSTPWFLDVSWACHEHDNPIPIWNTTYACSLFVSGNSLLHGFLMFLGRVMNMTIPSQYETPPMHAPFLFPEILYSMVSWCFLGVSWTWQSHPNMKHHLCMLPFCFRKFSTPWFLDVSWACHEHDNPIPIWNTTYACSLFVSGNSLLHGFLMFLGRVMNMTIPSQYETPPMHAPFLFPEILYSMVSWCFLGVSWTGLNI